MGRCVLITGFAPFGGARTNASGEAVRLLPDSLGDILIRRLLLPVEYGRAGEEVLTAAAVLCPDAVICTGVAGGREAVTPERIAVNWRSAAIADNAGVRFSGERIDPTGPDGIFTTLPAEKTVSALKAAGLPAAVSFTAGTYVCNDVFYHVLSRFRDTPVRSGFIHVPTEDRLEPARCRDALLICIRTAMEAEAPLI